MTPKPPRCELHESPMRELGKAVDWLIAGLELLGLLIEGFFS
jgi:hypothetical protein